ncbi:acyltransferase family protein [Allocoprococcus comes]|uniref:acyltransferase family protein n=1 Tax=Coprococcus comes TaxID=410072 RepID=UPI003D75C92D
MDRARNYLGGQTPVRAIDEAFTIRYIQPLWFIWVIIAAYIMFYAAFRHIEINVGAYWFAVITIAYILISAFVNPRDEMYASIIGMPLGILWAMYERKIDSYFEIGFLRKEIVAIVSFVILFIGRLTLSVVGFDNQLFQSVLRNIITIAFIVPLIELLKKVKIQKRFLIWLGTISYEIYIIHPFILYFFEKETTEGKQVGNLEIVLWTIGLTLLLSSVLKIVQDNLVRKVKL